MSLRETVPLSLQCESVKDESEGVNEKDGVARMKEGERLKDVFTCVREKQMER